MKTISFDEKFIIFKSNGKFNEENLIQIFSKINLEKKSFLDKKNFFLLISELRSRRKKLKEFFISKEFSFSKLNYVQGIQ